MAGVKGWDKEHKLAFLEILSSATIMTDLFPDFGNPTMKSMDRSVHIVGRIGNGCNDLGVSIVSPFFLWKISHSAKKVKISFYIPAQKKECLARAYVF